MNKVKMKFMQNAPTFVIVTGVLFLFFIVAVGLGLCFTKRYGFGLYIILLSSFGLTVVGYAVSKIGPKRLSDAISKDRKYWGTHDK